jgi:hypothetical protein
MNLEFPGKGTGISRYVFITLRFASLKFSFKLTSKSEQKFELKQISYSTIRNSPQQKWGSKRARNTKTKATEMIPKVIIKFKRPLQIKISFSIMQSENEKPKLFTNCFFSLSFLPWKGFE